MTKTQITSSQRCDYRDGKSAFAAIDRDIDPVFEIVKARGQSAPVIFAAPHSGRCYPATWLRRAALTKAKLRSVEDAYIDRLFGAAPRHGAALIRARFARSFVDVNRSRCDLALNQRGHFAGPESARARAGLGVIPLSIGANRVIYSAAPGPCEIEHRLSHYYDAYHGALDGLIETALSAHGQVLLIDCHSMPGGGAGYTARRPDIVLGDCFGTSCAPYILKFAAHVLRGMGYGVAINHPFAGGYITQHYGRPHDERHALQVEISRSLYMNAMTLRPTVGFDTLALNLSQFIRKMIAEFGEGAHSIAAQ